MNFQAVKDSVSMWPERWYESEGNCLCDRFPALDVSIQAQVLNLFNRLQQQYNLTYIFISHDLGVIKHVSDRIAIMYLGRIVELCEADAIYENPLHPVYEGIIVRDSAGFTFCQKRTYCPKR